MPAKKKTEKPAEKPQPQAAPVPTCDNHPDVLAVYTSDGVAASVINLCGDCKSRGN